MPRGKGGGPKTREGKARASRNARRHGLNTPITASELAGPGLAELARAFRAAGADPDLAREAAEARAGLLRVRQAQIDALQSQATEADAPDPAAMAVLANLPALAKLDAYERRARSRQKKALRRI